MDGIKEQRPRRSRRNTYWMLHFFCPMICFEHVRILFCSMVEVGTLKGKSQNILKHPSFIDRLMIYIIDMLI